MKYFYCVFLLFCFSNVCNALETDETKIQAVDNQIRIIEAQQHDLRLKAMKEEINTQPLMFEQWKEYAQHMKAVENLEENLDSLQRQVDALKEEKARLLQGASDHSQISK